jgi:hypothetical protein
MQLELKGEIVAYFLLLLLVLLLLLSFSLGNWSGKWEMRGN